MSTDTFLHDNIIEYCMSEALSEAQAAYTDNPQCADIPVGCVIADSNGNIVARAHNTRETSHLVTGHAEISALNAAAEITGDFRLNNLYLFVTLEPCPMCAGAIAAARPAAVFYGAPNTSNGACGTIYNILHPHVRVYGGIMSRESAALIRDFFEKLRNTASGNI
ncbi:MAG: nucleoside deaminase [Clostridia bacterium]|nr:nucleoside deaminase [Clostridia bacterium]